MITGQAVTMIRALPIIAPMTPGDSVDLQTDVPHSARIYDYLLGGKNHFAADRAAAHEILENAPGLPVTMRANRDFMRRVTRFLTAGLGMRQFLDIGTGLPTPPNLHEVAQEIAPETRVVYVDNDPIVLIHARALLTSSPEGRTAYVDADLRDPESILASPELRETLDLSRPVALSLIAILQFVPDDDEAYGVVARLMDALAPGSALAMSVVTADTSPDSAAASRRYSGHGIPSRPRTRAQVERFYAGLDLVDPGVQLVHRWRPDPDAPPLRDDQVFLYGGVGVKRASA
jgi:trans-aconitate methyltransferase